MNHVFFEAYMERLENLQREFRTEIQDLPAEAVDWVPGSGMNSVAVLLAHTAGSLRFWIGDAALQEPSARVRGTEFETRGLAGSVLMQRLDEVIEYARSALPRLGLGDLDQMRRPDPDRGESTCSWALLHALEHAYLHLGHIQLTCQLWRASAKEHHE